MQLCADLCVNALICCYLQTVTAVEKSLFLKHFYSHSMHHLMAPLMAQTASDKIGKGIICLQ